MNEQDLQTIRGYVQALPPALEKEEASRVAIITEDGAEYHVLHKGAGTGLFANINANVEVVGHVSPLESQDEAQPFAGMIAVKSYRLTDGFDDPWYDDAVR